MKKHYFVEGDGDTCLSCGEDKNEERHYGALITPPSGSGDGEGRPDDGDGEGEPDDTEGEGESEDESEGDGEGEGEGQGESEAQSPEPPERMVSVWGVPHDRDKDCPDDGCVAIEDGVAMVSPGGTFHLRDARPFHEVNSCSELGCEPFTE